MIKKYILGLFGILLLLTLFAEVKYLMYYQNVKPEEMKVLSNKSIAIMIQKGDTYEKYTSEDNTWPGADYVFKEAKCIDNNGAIVENAVTFADVKQH